MATPNSAGDDFEIVDSASVSFVRRGRKAVVDPGMVEKLSNLPKGKGLSIKKFALDPTSTTYAKDKGRVSSQIRNACKQAGLPTGTYEIRWSVDGIPNVLR